MKLYEEVEQLLEEVIDIRRELHKIPEPGFEEFKTAEYIENYLKELGISYESAIAGTGILAYIQGFDGTKAFCFRADMDGLNIEELNPVPYKSTHSCKMHACGHDGHMAVVLGLAKYLSINSSRLKDNVVLLFQPAEEGPGGALPIMESGILEKYRVKEIYGLHLFPEIQEGKIGVRPGPIMSQTGEFDIILTGKSGHGAMPHKAVDSIVAACSLVTGLQSVVSRSVDPTEPAVLTVGRIEGGEKRNVIARKVALEGTIRTFNQRIYDLIKKKMIDFKSGIETAYECSIDIVFRDMYPAVSNDELLTYEFIKSQEKDTVEIIQPIMLSEDFSYYQKKIPGVFFFLGTGNAENNYQCPLHNGKFNFDEKVLGFGLQAFINVLKHRGAII